MKQGLQLRLSQQLAMTPQLQQAIRLLQLSTLELQQELQQALDSNPLLEQTDLHDEVDTQQSQDTEALDTADALEQKEMPDELPLDASWDEIYTAGTPSGTRADYQDDELPVYQGETTQSLQDYLMWQVELTPFSDTDRAIATSIVDAVDDTGYLTVTLDDILESMGDDEIELEEVEAVLKRIQRFDPVGVAAKDLRDCLLIQLSQFSKETPWLEEARAIISDHLDLLANHDFRTLMRVTRLKEEVQAVLGAVEAALLRLLDGVDHLLQVLQTVAAVAHVTNSHRVQYGGDAAGDHQRVVAAHRRMGGPVHFRARGEEFIQIIGMQLNQPRQQPATFAVHRFRLAALAFGKGANFAILYFQ